MNPDSNLRRSLELVAAFIAAVDCLAVAILFSLSQASGPSNRFADLWPTPGLYFLEISALAILMLIAVSSQRFPASPFWQNFPWISAGIILAFVILGAWTIGPFLLPALLAFLVLGLLVDSRPRPGFSSKQLPYLAIGFLLMALALLGAWRLAGIFQAVLMLVILGFILITEARLAGSRFVNRLTSFLIAGISQALLIYLLLLLHLN
jgi:hypothetical protein